MELRHLRYVVTLAETLHFGRAAEQLHLSQPPLSHQIRQLEEELRIKLFQRTKRQVQLTEAGRMFVQEARVILAQAALAANLASRINQGEVGQLTIGVAGPADAPIFIQILRTFAQKHPKVRIVLRKPIMVALPPEHPLATHERVPLKLLSQEPQIMFARSNAPRFFDAVLAACREAGFSMNIAHEVDNLYTAYALVAAGLGVCLVPSGAQDYLSRPSMVVPPVSPALPNTEMHIALAYQAQSEN